MPSAHREGLAGLRQFGFWFGGGYLGGILKRGEDDGGGFLDHLKAFGEECRVAVVQVDVIRRCPAVGEADCLTDHKGDGLGFCLAYYLGCRGAPFGLVQQFVCEFVDEGAELLGGRLAGKDSDLASVAHAQSWGDALLELKQNSLRCDEIEQVLPPRNPCRR